MINLVHLHNQNLIDVMVELERTGSPNARFLHDLAESGRVHSLNENQLSPLRKQGKIFQRSEWASPILTDQLPFDNLPKTREIKNILMNEIGGENMYHFVPSRGTPELDAQAIVELLNNVGNSKYSAPGAILNARSPTFERLCKYKVEWPHDGTLSVSQVTMTVTPADDIQHTEYYDSYTLSTLLQGSRVWLAFPPLPGNFDALQAHYQLLATDKYALGMSTARDFQHGVLIIQKAGQGLMMPPFWTATAISTQMAVSATYHASAATDFVQRIKHLSVFRLTAQLGLSNEAQEQSRLISLASELVDHLQRILDHSFPYRKVSKVVIDVCREYETLRTGLRQALQAIDDMAIARGLENKHRAIWLKFLEEKRKKKPACRLCNVRVQDMPLGGSSTDRLRQHFSDFHCLRRERSMQPVAHM